MKKLLYILMIALCIFALIGCGEVKKTKLSAKLTEESGNIGKIESKIEVVFSNDVVSSVKEEKTFSKKEAAEEYFNLLSLMEEDVPGIKLEKSGNKVIETVSSPRSSYKYYGMSKKSLTTELENNGWKVD